MRHKEHHYYSEENQEIVMPPSIWREQMNKYEQNRRDFLDWVKNTYSPEKIYYPGSGTDKIPKEVLGEDSVVHLSLEENKEIGFYFPRLGPGQKVEGNFLKSPFKDGAFDAVFIHDTPYQVTIRGLSEFYRVLKVEGILLLDNGDWKQKEMEEFLSETQKLFEKQELPPQFNNPNNMLAHVLRLTSEHGGPVVGIATSEKELERMLRYIPAVQQHVIRQLFAVFKKRRVGKK
ncbi:class I SAM-dependent methyltransferase [Patescibacteria group bacterium AH-259-L07]|nr:class I SAM-dependent methyltransferase [Patescibacteria group bacterium AH-259-L07]